MTTLLALLAVAISQPQVPVPANEFDAWLARVAAAPASSRQRIADEYLNSARPTPLEEPAGIVFLARADAGGRPPHIVSDANNWARDTEDGTWRGDPMRPIEGTDVFFKRMALDPAARLSYRVAYSVADQGLDSLNDVSVMTFGTERSVVTMPGYRAVPETLGLDDAAARGTLERHELSSRFLGAPRTVQVYTPAEAVGRTGLPVVFFHDGSNYIEDAKVPVILDRLLAAERIGPLLAVFVDPVNRRSEYRMSPDYRRFFNEELIPWVDAHLPTRPDAAARAIYGGSRGALAAADLVLAEPRTVGHCICFSPATRPTDFPSTIEAASPDAPSFFILISRYDLRFRRDGRELADLLVGRGYDVTSVEVPDGHSVRAWQRYLGRGLASFSALAPR